MKVINSIIAIIRRINLKDQWMLGILLFLVLVFSVFGSGFLSGYNIRTIIIYNTEVMLIAVGELFTIIMGNIDLSVGSVLGLSGIIGSIVMRAAYANSINQVLSIILGFSAGLGTGALCGFINGTIISKIKVPAFVATLGMLGIARGVVFIITNGSPIMYLPPFLRWIGRGYFLNTIPVMFLIAIVVCLISGFILQQTRYGRYLYMHGGSKDATIRAGVNTDKLVIKAYVFSGVLAALAGMLLCARYDIGSPVSGQGRELDAIAAVVIGGASLYGGNGQVSKTIIGAFVISVLRIGLVNLGIQPYWQMVAVGCILIFAVYVDQFRKAN